MGVLFIYLFVILPTDYSCWFCLSCACMKHTTSTSSSSHSTFFVPYLPVRPHDYFQQSPVSCCRTRMWQTQGLLFSYCKLTFLCRDVYLAVYNTHQFSLSKLVSRKWFRLLTNWITVRETSTNWTMKRIQWFLPWHQLKMPNLILVCT